MMSQLRRVGPAALATGVLVAVSASARPAPLSFGPPSEFDIAGSEPRSIAQGDFNGDGRPDFAVACSGSDSDAGELSVLFGSASGSYDEADSYALGRTWGVAAGDVTGDGRDDLVVTNGGSGVRDVWVLTGAANGTFSTTAHLIAGSFPLAVAIGDFNEDGLNDIAVANNVQYGLSIFLNLGGGAFTAAMHQPGQASLHSTDIACSDFNHDGHLDLAVSHYGGVSTFRGVGNGTFVSGGGAGVNETCESVTAADLNGDGFDDIISGYIYSGVIRVRLNNGAGSFIGGGTYSVATFHRDTNVADINHDGLLDVVAVGNDSNVVSVLLNTGGGVLAAAQNFGTGAFPAGIQPSAVVATDVNGDGWDDLVAACRNLADTPTLAVLKRIPPPPCVGDLDGDGVISFGDLNILLGMYNSTGPDLAADLDDDGDVDFADLNALLGLYNTGC